MSSQCGGVHKEFMAKLTSQRRMWCRGSRVAFKSTSIQEQDGNLRPHRARVLAPEDGAAATTGRLRGVEIAQLNTLGCDKVPVISMESSQVQIHRLQSANMKSTKAAEFSQISAGVLCMSQAMELPVRDNGEKLRAPGLATDDLKVIICQHLASSHSSVWLMIHVRNGDGSVQSVTRAAELSSLEWIRSWMQSLAAALYMCPKSTPASEGLMAVFALWHAMECKICNFHMS